MLADLACLYVSAPQGNAMRIALMLCKGSLLCACVQGCPTDAEVDAAADELDRQRKAFSSNDSAAGSNQALNMPSAGMPCAFVFTITVL
jgi:hypothetical protein